MYGNPNDIFGMLTRNLKSISQVTREMILLVSLESEKLHYNLLLNRNKGEPHCNSHLSFEN